MTTRKLPLEIHLLLRCEGCYVALDENTETAARVPSAEGAAEDATTTLLLEAQRLGWRILEDGERAQCPACKGSGQRKASTPGVPR